MQFPRTRVGLVFHRLRVELESGKLASTEKEANDTQQEPNSPGRLRQAVVET